MSLVHDIGIAILLILAFAAVMASPAAADTGQSDPTPVRAFRAFTRGSAGLPGSTVITLHVDAEGTVWIATFDGAARVENGGVERLPASADAPATGPVYAMINRNGGGVHMVGNEALFTYDTETWTRTRTPQTFISIAEDASRSIIAVDRRGRLWLKTLAATSWSPIDTGSNDPTGIIALASTNDGQVLAAGANGVMIVDGAKLRGLLGGAAPPTALTSIKVARDGQVWTGGDDGRLYAWKKSTGWRTFDIPDWDAGRIRSLGEDWRGRIWAGAENGRAAVGSSAVPFERWTPVNGLHAATINAIAGDATGGVWFGFNGFGLQQWLGESWSHRTFWREPGDQQTPFVFSVRGTADGGLIAGVFNRGVLRWDGSTMQTYGREQGLTEDTRFAIEPEPGVIWAGTRFGIFEGRGGKFRQVLTLPTGFATGFFRTPDGRWWAGTSTHGVYVFDAGTWSPLAELNAQLPDPSIRDIVFRKSGQVWIATDRGLAIFDADLAKGPVKLQTPSLPSLPYAMIERGDEMWVAGVGGIAVLSGTVKDDGTGAWRTIAPEAGLPGGTMYSIATAPDGSVWVGGSAGVGRLQNNVWTVFDASDGLISEECNTFGMLVHPSGRVFVGTMSGLAEYGVDLPPQAPPPLRLFWRTIGVGPTGALALRSSDRRLVLQWSAPWPRPTVVEYRTRIRELTDAWTEPQTSPILRIENLGAGNYTVDVSARLRHAGANAWTDPVTAKVTVAPLWWETWWTRLGVLALFIVGIVAVVRWRTSRLKRRARELEAAVAAALSKAKVLQGLLPICAHCKKVRDDQGYWTRIEDYISAHSEAEFSHGYCADCIDKHYAEAGIKTLDG
jgi:ligand-binding sensor domain-containing protein